jgi:c(7)-type cytochrome triheme protein
MTTEQPKNGREFSSISRRRRCQFAVFAAGCAAFVCFLIFSPRAGMKISEDQAEFFAVSKEFSIVSSEEKAENAGAQNYSRFTHSNPMHARLPCLLCHKRTDNSPVPRLPGHLPCAGCHQQQFDAGNQHPICAICHTATSVKRFPPLRSFNARFDHARHQRQTNCATCHKPARRGVGFSIPADLNAHSSCFQCHTAQAQTEERSLGSCGLCHQPGRPPAPVSDWAKAYTVNFSHAAHGASRDLNCASCHTIRAGMPRGRQVSAPTAAMHFAPARTQSCASCHNDRRAFGGDDFSDCRRCHTGRTFRF